LIRIQSTYLKNIISHIILFFWIYLSGPDNIYQPGYPSINWIPHPVIPKIGHRGNLLSFNRISLNNIWYLWYRNLRTLIVILDIPISNPISLYYNISQSGTDQHQITAYSFHIQLLLRRINKERLKLIMRFRQVEPWNHPTIKSL